MPAPPSLPWPKDSADTGIASGACRNSTADTGLEGKNAQSLDFVVSCMRSVLEGQRAMDKRLSEILDAVLHSQPRNQVTNAAQAVSEIEAKAQEKMETKTIGAEITDITLHRDVIHESPDAFLDYDGFKEKHYGNSMALLEQRNIASTHSFLRAKNWLNYEETLADVPEKSASSSASRMECAIEWLRVRIENGKFDMFSGVFIILNALIMVLKLEHSGYKVGLAHGLPGNYSDHEGTWPGADAIFHVTDVVFNTIFLVELILRFVALRFDFFKSAWTYLDIGLVASSIFDMFSNSGGANLSFMRLLRLLRLLKAMRFLKVMKALRQLNLLMTTIVSGMGALFWSALLIGSIELIAAILMGQIVQGTIDDAETDEEIRLFLWRYFGTASRSFLTMFDVTLAGWFRVGRPMIEEVSPWYALFWLPYVVFVSFTCMKIVGALFIKETIAQANKMHAQELEDRLGPQGSEMKELGQIMKQYLGDDMQMSKSEFTRALEDPGVCRWLRNFDLDPERVMGLHELTDDGDGQMSVEEFLAAVFSMNERHVDTCMLFNATRKVINWMRTLEAQLESINTRQEEQIREIYFLAKDLHGITLHARRVA